MTDRLWNWDDPLQRCPEMGESRAANQGLRDYALMGARRSLRSLVSQYANAPQTLRPPTRHWRTISTWSVRYEWVARVNRWQKLEQERAQKRWEERQDQIRERGWNVGEALIDKAEKMLAYPLEEMIIDREVKDADGRVIKQYITISPANWSQGTAHTMAKAGIDTCRVSAEMETDRTKLDIDWRNKFKKAGVDPQEIFNALVEAKVERMKKENDHTEPRTNPESAGA